MKEHIGETHEHGVCLGTRTVFFFEEINEESARRFVKNLHILDNFREGTITVFLSSEGGDVTHGLSMYDAIRGCKNHVRIVCFGEVASMATLVLQAGDERCMLPNSYLLVHYGEEGISSQHPKNVERVVAHNKELEKVMLDLYMKRIKEKKKRFTKEQLHDLLVFDTMLKPKQAIDLGLADRIEDDAF